MKQTKETRQTERRFVKRDEASKAILRTKRKMQQILSHYKKGVDYAKVAKALNSMYERGDSKRADAILKKTGCKKDPAQWLFDAVVFQEKLKRYGILEDFDPAVNYGIEEDAFLLARGTGNEEEARAIVNRNGGYLKLNLLALAQYGRL